jgi:hypothetical protein
LKIKCSTLPSSCKEDPSIHKKLGLETGTRTLSSKPFRKTIIKARRRTALSPLLRPLRSTNKVTDKCHGHTQLMETSNGMISLWFKTKKPKAGWSWILAKECTTLKRVILWVLQELLRTLVQWLDLSISWWKRTHRIYSSTMTMWDTVKNWESRLILTFSERDYNSKVQSKPQLCVLHSHKSKSLIWQQLNPTRMDFG